MIDRHANTMNLQPRILIYADHNDDRYLLTHFLRYCEFDVRDKKNTSTIIEDVQNLKPDLLVLSDRLSPLDGYQLSKMLRKEFDDKSPCIIILVDNASNISKTQAQRAGANDIVARPQISDKDYSYFKITEFVHRHLINKCTQKSS